MITRSFSPQTLKSPPIQEKKQSPSDPGIILASNVGAHSIRWRALVGAQQCRQLAQSKRPQPWKRPHSRVPRYATLQASDVHLSVSPSAAILHLQASNVMITCKSRLRPTVSKAKLAYSLVPVKLADRFKQRTSATTVPFQNGIVFAKTVSLKKRKQLFHRITYQLLCSSNKVYFYSSPFCVLSLIRAPFLISPLPPLLPPNPQKT